jgi:CII-binding regulator of phage lambda lysogenization HflD
MAEYTKGVWRTESGQATSGPAHHQIISAQVGKTIFVADFGTDETGQANSNLVCTAVNACAELNPGNPLAVSEDIKDLYITLRDLVELLNNRKIAAFLNSNSLGWSMRFEKAQKTLDKVQGK